MPYSKKSMGKEVGSASTYAAPHSGTKSTDGQIPKKPYAGTKKASDVNLKDPIQNGVSYGVGEEKTDGIAMRGKGCATKGFKSRGPMA